MFDIDRLIDQVQEAAAVRQNINLQSSMRPKIVVGLGRTVLSKVLGFNLRDWFFDPKVCLESQLKWKLLWHREIQDDTVIKAEVGVEFGVALEPTLFGMQPLFRDNEDPWYGEPVLQARENLETIELPDFYRSGLMPQVHELYQDVSDLVKGKIPVTFPGWARGPWSIACMIRGFTPLYMDLIGDPDFVHRLMQFIVDARIHFETQRCRFLGIDPQDTQYRWYYCVYRPSCNSALFNDEVDGNLFSQQTYREFILPYERQLAEFYGGVSYYHSCGNMTPFYEDLCTLPNLNRLHVSQSSELGKAMQLKERFTIENSLDPYEEILQGSDAHIEEKFEAIKAASTDKPLEVWADALYVGGRDTVEKARNVVRIFRNAFGSTQAQ
jgi:uroporphyrinogen-III decarboxylase